MPAEALLRQAGIRLPASGVLELKSDAVRYNVMPSPSPSFSLPPASLTDAAAWDRYWEGVAASGFGGLLTMFCRDGELVDVVRAAGFHSVLCVGNGISVEPRALEAAGLDVTVLDLSPRAASLLSAAKVAPDVIDGLLEGRSRSPGGRLRFVTADLMNPDACPGPFDVVIERLTLQLFDEKTRPQALEAVARRLAPRGIFLSHCHDGSWKPPAPPRHATKKWFVANGWMLWEGVDLESMRELRTHRVAWLQTSTG
jgi:SAM-dependent methyltransferase